MDDIDRKLLNLLQVNADLPLSEIAKKVGVSSTPCWNRIKRLEEKGIIKYKISVVDKEKVGYAVTVFLSISVSNHNSNWFTEFEKVREFLFEFSIDEMFVIFLFFPRSSSSKWSAISLAPTEFLNLYTNAPPQKIPHIYFLFAFHCIRAIQKYYLFAYKFYFSVIYNILGPHIFFLHRFRRSR